MLEENKTDIRIARHNEKGGGQEDFTPVQIIELLCQGSEDIFTDFSKTVCDPCAGICYILCYILEHRLLNCKSFTDIKNAVSTLYGTELYEDNVVEGRQNILDTIINYSNIEISKDNMNILKNIIEDNIVCTDTFKWDYENWCPIQEYTTVELF